MGVPDSDMGDVLNTHGGTKCEQRVRGRPRTLRSQAGSIRYMRRGQLGHRETSVVVGCSLVIINKSS